MLCTSCPKFLIYGPGESLVLTVVDAGVQHNIILALAHSATEEHATMHPAGTLNALPTQVFDIVLRLCKTTEAVPTLGSRPAGQGILLPGETLTLHAPW